jgi:hypothetical protein
MAQPHNLAALTPQCHISPSLTVHCLTASLFHYATHHPDILSPTASSPTPSQPHYFTVSLFHSPAVSQSHCFTISLPHYPTPHCPTPHCFTFRLFHCFKCHCLLARPFTIPLFDCPTVSHSHNITVYGDVYLYHDTHLHPAKFFFSLLYVSIYTYNEHVSK